MKIYKIYKMYKQIKKKQTTKIQTRKIKQLIIMKLIHNTKYKYAFFLKLSKSFQIVPNKLQKQIKVPTCCKTIC